MDFPWVSRSNWSTDISIICNYYVDSPLSRDCQVDTEQGHKVPMTMGPDHCLREWSSEQSTHSGSAAQGSALREVTLHFRLLGGREREAGREVIWLSANGLPIIIPLWLSLHLAAIENSKKIHKVYVCFYMETLSFFNQIYLFKCFTMGRYLNLVL